MYVSGASRLVVLIQLQGSSRLGHVLHDLPDGNSNLGACDCPIELGFMGTQY